MRRLIALLMLGLMPGVALANDPLARFAPWFAANPSGLVFHYSAPLEGFKPDSPTLQGPSDDGLRTILLSQSGVDTTSGLDLDAVTGTMTIGAPPNDLLVVLGSEDFADGVEPALLARNFEKREIAGFTVLGKGDDNSVDLINARKPDPFAGGLGKAQRVALGDGFVAVARGWPGIEVALAEPARTEGSIVVWQATLGALNQLRGDGHLDAAWGWSGDSFAGTLLDPATLLGRDIEEAIAAVEGGPQLLFSPFPLAIFALDRDEASTHLRIALPYGESENAEAAAAYVAMRLVEFPKVPARPEVELVEMEDLTIAVLTLTYPASETSAANALMLSWNGAVMQRNFTPLQFGLY